jgi:hypothetical protein
MVEKIERLGHRVQLEALRDGNVRRTRVPRVKKSLPMPALRLKNAPFTMDDRRFLIVVTPEVMLSGNDE